MIHRKCVIVKSISRISEFRSLVGHIMTRLWLTYWKRFWNVGENQTEFLITYLLIIFVIFQDNVHNMLVTVKSLSFRNHKNLLNFKFRKDFLPPLILNFLLGRIVNDKRSLTKCVYDGLTGSQIISVGFVKAAQTISSGERPTFHMQSQRRIFSKRYQAGTAGNQFFPSVWLIPYETKVNVMSKTYPRMNPFDFS